MKEVHHIREKIQRTDVMHFLLFLSGRPVCPVNRKGYTVWAFYGLRTKTGRSRHTTFLHHALLLSNTVFMNKYASL